MKNLIAAVILLTAIGFQGPQQPAQPSQAGPITEASIRGHMEFLASDAMNGRGSGTRDEWIAAEYIASHLRRWGIAPLGPAGASHVQRIELRASEATAPPVLNVGDLTLTHGKQMIVQALGTVSRVVGPLIVYKPGTRVTAGSVVLVPETLTAEDRTALAPASLVIAPETAQIREGWARAGAALPTAPPRPIDLPAIASPRATRIAVDKPTYASLVSMAGARVFYDPPLKYSDTPSYTWNTLGILRGTDTPINEVILLSAHLDHLGMRENAPGADKIYNGADDNATGSVAVLELAKALAEGPRPKRTIVFAWFGSEERRGVGSDYVAEMVLPAEILVANLQFEMIGRPDPEVPAKTLWLTGFERSTLGPELARHGARLVADPHPEQNFFMRSDNYRFAQKGVPAHTVSSYGLHKDYHQPSDEIRTIDFPHMTEAIRSMLEPVRWLSNTSWRPKWVPGGRPR